MKVLKQKVEGYELRDYRVKAEKLTPKGDYFGMNNFSRSLSVASYFSRGLLHSYPSKMNTPSLIELVAAEDEGVVDEVFVETGLSSSRSEKGLYSTMPGRYTHSDSEVTRKRQASSYANLSESSEQSKYDLFQNNMSKS